MCSPPFVGNTSKRIRGRMHDRWVGQSPLGRRERLLVAVSAWRASCVRGAIQLTREQPAQREDRWPTQWRGSRDDHDAETDDETRSRSRSGSYIFYFSYLDFVIFARSTSPDVASDRADPGAGRNDQRVNGTDRRRRGYAFLRRPARRVTHTPPPYIVQVLEKEPGRALLRSPPKLRPPRAPGTRAPR